MPDLNCDSIESAMAMVAGAARSMGAGGRWTDARRTARSTRPRRRTATSRSTYQPRQALEIVKKSAFAKFDETVEVAVRLGVDPRHADQVVRGTVVLPAGTGKTVRVLVIAVGDKAREAEARGRRLRRHRVHRRRSRTAGSTSTS